MTSDLLSVLYGTRQLLQRGWCSRALARTGTGQSCHPHDAKATAWSLHGATMRAAFEVCADPAFAQARDLLKDAVWREHHLYLMWCDDHPSFGAQDALALVDGLIAQCTPTPP